jgi:O-antigen ligase
VSFLSRDRRAAKFRAIAEDIPLSLLCFSFGPLIYVASLGTVAAMLLAACMLIASRDRLPIIAKSIRALSTVVPLLVWMLASAAWSPDSEAAANVMLRVAVLFSGGTLLVASFALLPLQRLRRPLIASALGLSAAGAIIAVDLASGGHLARVFRGPRLEDLNPALAYGRAATLHAMLFAPILVGVLRLGRPWLAAGYALLAAVAILETASLSAKTALAASLLGLVLVFVLPRLRWAGLTFLSFGVIALPVMFPLPLDPEATCWLANHKPSALHRLEIWSFVAEHIKERPVAGWGLDAARRLPGGSAQMIIRHCDAAERPDGVALSSQILPLHPHNAILQVWLELGGVGIALGFGLLILLIWHAFRIPAWRARLTQAMIAGSSAAAVSVGLVSFGIWQEWFVSGLFIVAAFIVLAARQSAAASECTILPEAPSSPRQG